MILGAAAAAVACAIALGPYPDAGLPGAGIIPLAAGESASNLLGLGAVGVVAVVAFAAMLASTCLYRGSAVHATGPSARPAGVEMLWSAVPILIFIGMASLAARDLAGL